LRNVLLSKDLSLYEAYKKDFFEDGLGRFLDKSPIDGERICYLTYTRSGNTFLRKYIELVTGVITGSEFTTKLPFPL
jgi:hypothetical protein